MLKEFVIVLITIIFSSIGSQIADNAEAQEKLPFGIIASNNNFAFQLLGELNTTEQNVVFSPYSISASLSMLAAGAKDQTQAQILTALSLPILNAQSFLEFGALRNVITKPADSDDSRLDIANSLWIQSNYTLLDSYLEIITKYFSAEINSVDFKGKIEESRLKINKWAAEKTKDKISNLIGKGALSENSRLVLVNAVYFLAAWDSPFSEQSTYEGNFKTSKGSTSLARFMSQKKYFKYAENSEVQAIELPYAGNTIAMDILLPKSTETGALQKISRLESIEYLLNTMKTTNVQLHIPKFKVDSSYSLPQVLSKLGIKDAFESGKADFSAINGNHELFVNEVIHKAIIDVDENGTEAAAATAILMQAGSAMQSNTPISFKADHPFIYMLRDIKSSTILFIGALNNPQQ